jgi:hypothetical protein
LQITPIRKVDQRLLLSYSLLGRGQLLIYLCQSSFVSN